MQIKTTMGYQLDTGQNCHHQKNLQTINAGEDVEKREPSWIGVNINWYNHHGKQYGDSLKNMTAIPLLVIYPEKITIQKDTYTPVFIAALFTIARTWRQPRCPSTVEQIKIWYIYTLEYYSAIKRNEWDLVALRWMNLEPVVQSEVRKRKTNIVY